MPVPLSVADLKVFKIAKITETFSDCYIPGTTQHNRPDSEIDIVYFYLIII